MVPSTPSVSAATWNGTSGRRLPLKLPINVAVFVECRRLGQDATGIGVVALGEEVERTAGERLRVEAPGELDAADLDLIGATV